MISIEQARSLVDHRADTTSIDGNDRFVMTGKWHLAELEALCCSARSTR